MSALVMPAGTIPVLFFLTPLPRHYLAGLETALHRKEIDKFSVMKFENRYLPEKPYPI
jgi:hypothetical protein